MLALRRYVEIGHEYFAHVRVLRRACPWWALATAICSFVYAGAVVVSMVATGHVVGALPGALRDGTSSGSASQLWTWFTVFAALNVGAPLINGLSEAMSARVSAAYLEYVIDLVAEAGVGPPGLEKLDSPGYSGRLAAILKVARGWWFRQGIDQAWQVLQTRLVGVGAVIVLLPWRWWVPLIVVVSFLVLARAFGQLIDAFWSRQLQQDATDLRRARYFRRLLTRPEPAKEVRLFGLSGWLADRYRTAWLTASKAAWADRTRKLGPLAWAGLFVAITIGGSLALLAHDALSGRVGIAWLVTALQAILALESFGIIGEAQTGLSILTSTLRSLTSVRHEAGLPPLDPASPEVPPIAARRSGAATVDIMNVGFTYPTRDSATLHNVTLTIPAGQSLAIVGVNGAGKSTLIKLVAGLYAPDSGSVRINGADPFESAEARRRVAVIFQDFVRYPLTLRDNVGFGAIGYRHTQSILDQALMDAGGEAVLARLDEGWDTVLSREFDGGTDLSGGQWQRVALARALAAVNSGAGVLVLDEPSAALDVRAEAALFDRFLTVSRNVTTILVSHRLSSVRQADRIVVLDGESGAITEDGSHEELVAAGGAYAEMFTLQASRFEQAGGGR